MGPLSSALLATPSARTRALLVGVVTLGAGAVALAAERSIGRSPATLALLAAGVVATEIFQIAGDAKAIDPIERQSFSLSFAVIGAAALILGPLPATLVAPLGVLVVDWLKGKQIQKIAFNASMFALMGLAGGYAFVAIGGQPGHFRLPHDFVAAGGMVIAAYGVETILLGTMIALESGRPLFAHQREKIRSELPAAAGEAALAVVLACLARSSPWAIIAVLPLIAAVYQSKARLTTLRRETEHALETLANIVDERDRSTYRHSARVADYVRALAEALGLSPGEVQRARWAGRLHDLGKIRVDSSVLGKQAPLSADELEAMRLHPRVSARLLRRFRLAVTDAQAVEYHHERTDGRGYYGVNGEDIPFVAHLLSVADAFDAMTSDRPYRRSLSRDAALERIEQGLGTQFHPVVGKAFVALQRGLELDDVLKPADRAELQHLRSRNAQRRVWSQRSAPRPSTLAIAGVVASLAFVGVGWHILAAVAAVTAGAGAVLYVVSAERAHRLTAALVAIADGTEDTSARFGRLVDRLVTSAPLTWAALVSWSDRSLDATAQHEWRTAVQPPSSEALTSWLIRELESRDSVVVADGSEFGRRGYFLALVLRDAGSPVGSLVLGFRRRPPASVAEALGAADASLAALLDRPADEDEHVEPLRPVLAAVSL